MSRWYGVGRGSEFGGKSGSGWGNRDKDKDEDKGKGKDKDKEKDDPRRMSRTGGEWQKEIYDPDKAKNDPQYWAKTYMYDVFAKSDPKLRPMVEAGERCSKENRDAEYDRHMAGVKVRDFAYEPSTFRPEQEQAQVPKKDDDGRDPDPDPDKGDKKGKGKAKDTEPESGKNKGWEEV